MKRHSKMLSFKWWPSYSGLNMFMCDDIHIYEVQSQIYQVVCYFSNSHEIVIMTYPMKTTGMYLLGL